MNEVNCKSFVNASPRVSLRSKPRPWTRIGFARLWQYLIKIFEFGVRRCPVMLYAMCRKTYRKNVSFLL